MRRSPTQTSVFKGLLNCASEMSLSRNATGREFQRHGPQARFYIETGRGNCPLNLGLAPLKNIWAYRCKRSVLWLLKYTKMCYFVWGGAPHSAERAHDTLPDPLVGCMRRDTILPPLIRHSPLKLSAIGASVCQGVFFNCISPQR